MKRMRINKETSFKEVKKSYATVDLENCVSLTQYVDALMFKAHTTQEILDFVNEAKEVKFTESNDFKTCARIQAHINYRKSHDKFDVSLSKANKQRYTKLDR